MKRIVSAILVITMVLTSAVSVFAADTRAVTEEEILDILRFLNQTEFQKAILIRRGDETPIWSTND